MEAVLWKGNILQIHGIAPAKLLVAMLPMLLSKQHAGRVIPLIFALLFVWVAVLLSLVPVVYLFQGVIRPNGDLTPPSRLPQLQRPILTNGVVQLGTEALLKSVKADADARKGALSMHKPTSGPPMSNTARRMSKHMGQGAMLVDLSGDAAKKKASRFAFLHRARSLNMLARRERDILPDFFFDDSVHSAVISCLAQNSIVKAEATCVAGILHKIRVLSGTWFVLRSLDLGHPTSCRVSCVVCRVSCVMCRVVWHALPDVVLSCLQCCGGRV